MNNLPASLIYTGYCTWVLAAVSRPLGLVQSKENAVLVFSIYKERVLMFSIRLLTSAIEAFVTIILVNILLSLEGKRFSNRSTYALLFKTIFKQLTCPVKS